MGGGFDARIMGYLELDYTKFAECVLTGDSDAECWDYCVKMTLSQMTYPH